MNHEVKSAVRILQLVEFLAGCREPVTLKEIIAALGFPKSSGHALAQTLVSRGYAIQDSADRYRLVAGDWHGSPLRAKEARLISAAHPLMEDLRNRCGETVLLSTRTPSGEMKRLAKSVSRQAVRYDIDLNAPTVAFCTAAGRILLAFWESERVEDYLARTPLIAYTPYTVTDAARLRTILADVRACGIAINDREYVLESAGVAAPIREHDGHVIAALNLGTLAVRFEARRDEIIAAVAEAAAEVSKRLGYRGGATASN
jgi:DNA-binding IclR family transcriptional regulator